MIIFSSNKNNCNSISNINNNNNNNIIKLINSIFYILIDLPFKLIRSYLQ